MKGLADSYLIAQVVLFNEQRAFEPLVKKYQGTVRRFFLHQTGGNTALSDDLSQETFVKAYTHLSEFKQLSGFSTWLLRIAYNIFYDYFRTAGRTDEITVGEANRVEASAGSSDHEMDVQAALSRLRPEERTCVVLFYMNDLPLKQIVKVTGMPEGTIKSHISRGKQKLASFLKDNGYESKGRR